MIPFPRSFEERQPLLAEFNSVTEFAPRADVAKQRRKLLGPPDAEAQAKIDGCLQLRAKKLEEYRMRGYCCEDYGDFVESDYPDEVAINWGMGAFLFCPWCGKRLSK